MTTWGLQGAALADVVLAALGVQKHWWQGSALNPYLALRAEPAGDAPCR